MFVQIILLPHFDIPYGFGLGKIPYDLPFQGPVFFGLPKYTPPTQTKKLEKN